MEDRFIHISDGMSLDAVAIRPSSAADVPEMALAGVEAAAELVFEVVEPIGHTRQVQDDGVIARVALV